MRHASLFSGIGGFDLAAQWMGWTNVFQVEIDPFCQKVLEKNFPTTKRYGDIKQFDGTKYRGSVDVLTGGFPCQPYSTAGKRKGKEDDRHLWPEMLRVVREVQPGYVVGENVRGLTNWSGGLVFDEVQADLETEGYQVLPFLLPACAVNAPHRRDRIWFIAYSDRYGKSISAINEYSRTRKLGIVTHASDFLHAGELDNGRNTGQKRGSKSSDESEGETSFRERIRVESFTGSQVVTDTNSIQRRKGGLHTEGIEATERYTSAFNSWNDRGTWQDFPTQPPVCGRNDGVSNRMDRIKALGNAVVPQIPFEIFKAIEAVSSGK